MKTFFRTNLDEPQRYIWDLNERWPAGAPLPRTGERVIFMIDRRRSFELEVCQVSFNYAANEAIIELHLPSWQRTMTLTEWRAWFRAHASDSESGGEK